jgi:two-component system, chemotaxis family, CheB/CheR fusion protein
VKTAKNTSPKSLAHSKETSEVKKLKEELASKERDLAAKDSALRERNEQLSVLNEELQTTNEDLRVTNQELIVTGDALRAANDQAHNVLEELQSVSDIPALFLNAKVCIVNFTPGMNRLVRLTVGDVGRPAADFSKACLGEGFEADAQKVLATAKPLSSEVLSGKTWYLRHMFPRLTDGMKISGVTVSFTDITERKGMEEQISKDAKELRQSNQELTRFNRAMVDRELRMIEMKEEVNELCKRLGEPKRYEPQS